MQPPELLNNPLFLRAVVVGILGGTGLGLTVWFSRRGPLIFPVYAALLAALALLIARYPLIPYTARFAAALAGFLVANTLMYVVVGRHAARSRESLVKQGKLPPSALEYRTGVWGHAWRFGFL